MLQPQAYESSISNSESHICCPNWSWTLVPLVCYCSNDKAQTKLNFTHFIKISHAWGWYRWWFLLLIIAQKLFPIWQVLIQSRARGRLVAPGADNTHTTHCHHCLHCLLSSLPLLPYCHHCNHCLLSSLPSLPQILDFCNDMSADDFGFYRIYSPLNLRFHSFWVE